MDSIEIIKCGIVNCYLIKGKEKSILVDTALYKYRNYIYNKIKDFNISLIILTHAHVDHIGCTKFLADKLNVPVAIHYDDYKLSKDNTIHKIYADSLVGNVLKLFSQLNFKTKIQPFEPKIFLENNQSLKDYGIDAKVVSLKGHTKGSIGIIVNDKEFIVGDAMMNMTYITPSLIYENKKAMLNSVTKIKNSNAEKIYVGHGKPFDIDKIKNI